jgi:hypothetical protein
MNEEDEEEGDVIAHLFSTYKSMKCVSSFISLMEEELRIFPVTSVHIFKLLIRYFKQWFIV